MTLWAEPLTRLPPLAILGASVPNAPDLPPPPRNRYRISYRLSLALALPLLVALTGAVITARTFLSASANVEGLADALFREVARQALERARSHMDQAVPAAELLRLSAEESGDPAADREALVRQMLAVLGANPGFSWVSYGAPDGSFTGVYRRGDEVRVNRSDIVAGKTVMEEHRVLPGGARELVRHEDDTGYDPRTRPFYRKARERGDLVWTDPYVFYEQGVPGITLAAPVRRPGGADGGVFTVDFGLNALSGFVRGLRPSEHGEVMLFASDGRLLGHPRVSIVERAGGRGEGEIVRLADVDDPATRAFERALGDGSGDLCRGGRDATRRIAFAVEGAPHRALVQCFPVAAGGGRGASEGDLVFAVAVVAPDADFFAEVRENNAFGLTISALAVLAAVALALVLASRVAGPLGRIADEMAEVGRFELEERARPRSLFVEIETMQRALAAMKNGLRSFAAFVPAELVRRLVASGERAELGGRVRTITVSFSDLAGFTTMSESMSPDRLVEKLGTYFDEVTGVVEAHGGTVDKFIGDAVMAFWGAPQEVEDHAIRACESVIRAQRRLEALAGTAEHAWMRETKTRFGLATGEALVGNIGTPSRMNYTAMGDVVNLAARLEGLNKQYGTVAMVAESTYALAKGRVVARAIDVVAVKGKAHGVRVYELLALAEEDRDGALRDLEARSGRALDAYVAGEFAAAAAAWEAIAQDRPGDPVATTMARRARGYAEAPPPGTWSGVHVATEK